MTTVSTVGYGDRYPVTGQAASSRPLMVGGIALIGVVTASLPRGSSTA
jgi:voltage-gated potassium channel